MNNNQKNKVRIPSGKEYDAKTALNIRRRQNIEIKDKKLVTTSRYKIKMPGMRPMLEAHDEKVKQLKADGYTNQTVHFDIGRGYNWLEKAKAPILANLQAV